MSGQSDSVCNEDGLVRSGSTPNRAPAVVTNWKKLSKFVLTSVAVMTGIALSISLHSALRKATARVAKSAAAPRSSDAAKHVIVKNLDWADVQAAAGLETHLAAVKEFFAAARSQTRSYSETVLGWDSKWKMAADFFRGSKDHEQYLESQFEAMLFSKDDLDRLLRQTVSAYLRHTQDVEAQMLVRMKVDLEQLPPGSLPGFVGQSALTAALERALKEAMNAAQADMAAAAGREVISYVAGEVLAMVATELATSAGILTVGAGTSWATFGLGVVVSLCVDAIVTEIYQQQFDPAGRLTVALQTQLDQMEQLILHGTAQQPGLELRLREYSKNRNLVRRHAIDKTVLAF